MKKYNYVLFVFFIGFLILYSYKVKAILPLTGKTIVIDVGHGSLDVGTSYNNVYEKDLNLKISHYLEKELSSMGAFVILTREDDYDLSKPNTKRRKKSDFDNRIKLINNSNADLYISIHLNYLSNSLYYGPQVFYNNDNEELANYIQNSMNKYTNGKRKIKNIPKDTYMYKKLNIKGILIECGFLSNKKERDLLQTSKYQKLIAKSIVEGVLKYF